MLSPEALEKITQVLGHHPRKREACIEALSIAQEHAGYVSDSCLRELAALLDMTPDELDSVATFFNLVFRKPTGRHVILVCDSISCWVLGYENVLDHLQHSLGIRPGQTTPDGVFTLLTVPCLGACDRAPAMMVGSDLHTNLTEERIDSILESYREGADR